MKHRMLAVLVLLGLMSAFSVTAAAQAGYCTVKGTLKGTDGNPIPNVQVELTNATSGQKYHLKTDKTGGYYSLGIAPGQYNIDYLRDGKLIWKITNYNMSLQKENALNVIDVDLAKEYAAQQKQPQLTEEQKKAQEQAAKQNEVIKNLNAMLQQAAAAKAAGNLDQAISIYTQATQADASHPIIWALLGDANLASAKKDTDADSKKQKLETASNAYKKAIDLATASTDPKVKAGLGGYYNNFGEVLSRQGKTDDAVKSYQAAAAADPTNSAMYYFNEGATMENIYKIDEAVAAYDKAIAADPTKPDPYYRKGIALLSKATTKGDKMVPAPGTAEALNKYLELAPDGPNAETAKQMLATIGAPVQTSFGKQKKK